MTKNNALKELSDMMKNKPNMLDDLFSDIDGQISLKKIHIKETRNMMKSMPDMKERLQKIIDEYQNEIDKLVAKKKENA